MTLKSPQPTGLFMASIFFLIAIALSGTLPLWLDEIIQLRQTTKPSTAQLITALPLQPGAAPLGYLVQQASLRITGYSVRWARFPSALFLAAAVLVVAMLGAELGLEKPWLASAFFALFPVTLRYASESRIYAQALFLSILATLLFMRLVKRPTYRLAALYCLVLIAAIYTQPYAIFVGLAHVVWAATYRDRPAGALSTTAVAFAIAAFLPWYFWTKANWSSGLAGVGIHFVYSAKTPLMLFREVAGAGYWGSGLLLILCALAIGRLGQHPQTQVFLLTLVGVPIVLALAADGIFGYFIAARQILWVLPAVAILAAQGIERNARVAVPVAVLFAALSIGQSYRFFFQTTREDWQIAANALSGEVKNNACMVVVPAEQALSYEFFRPNLADSHCPAPRTVVAFTPYATETQRQTTVASLNAQGYKRQYNYEMGKSEIALFSR